jgi:hypothetical protein
MGKIRDLWANGIVIKEKKKNYWIKKCKNASRLSELNSLEKTKINSISKQSSKEVEDYGP